ncbi:uncharacterized protein B0H18DRAFT_1129202 [Fomitopsis serialis]|uniref:uncharacterized protein n=1 Tax=Fomitopsis serialis TaxID=139415 RepID=UPI002008297D|nr:uncharacterized protein B0H18DRAFT_1129202 [Neoantrodia serialis]KAH9910987.1 hypothetical protein B0H18DRAFT_1129202 [Neoantrodia serialis]
MVLKGCLQDNTEYIHRGDLVSYPKTPDPGQSCLNGINHNAYSRPPRPFMCETTPPEHTANLGPSEAPNLGPSKRRTLGPSEFPKPRAEHTAEVSGRAYGRILGPSKRPNPRAEQTAESRAERTTEVSGRANNRSLGPRESILSPGGQTSGSLCPIMVLVAMKTPHFV